MSLDLCSPARNGAGTPEYEAEKVRQGASYSEIWRLSRPCSGVMNQSSSTSRPLIWEDEAPAESRFRRVRQSVPRAGGALPGMPLEMEDPEGEDDVRRGRKRFGSAQGRWWWPSNTVGRVFVGLGAAIILGGLATAGVLLKHSLERDARFRIAGTGNIQATGLTEVSRAQILPVFGEDIGRNIFFVPIGERRRELEAIPWVENATVMRVLPNEIRVSVVERKPVAFTRHGQQIGLVDASGVLLDMSAATMAEHHYSFPVLTGIDAGDRAAARQARMAVYGRLMAELDANNQHYSNQISEIDLTDPEDAAVLMPAEGGDILAHFGEDHFLERYQRYKAHIAEWRQQYPKLAQVDLRYEHQVVLEMASGAATAQPTAQLDGGAKGATGAQGAPVLKAAQEKSAAGRKAEGKAAESKAGGKSAVKSPEKTGTTAKARDAAEKRAAEKRVAAKKKAARDKKRAQARRVALSASKRKSAAKSSTKIATKSTTGKHPQRTEGR